MSPSVCHFWYPPHIKRLTIYINLYNQETSFHWKCWWEVERLFPWKFSDTVRGFWFHALSGPLTVMPLWQPCEWKDLHPQDRKWKCYSVSRVWVFATPWTVTHQAPLSMKFSRQEYRSGLPFPSPGDPHNPGIEPRSPALQADSLPSEPPGKLTYWRACLSPLYFLATLTLQFHSWAHNQR